jgi:putative ABC transport system permease protein
MYDGYSPMQADLIVRVNKNEGANIEYLLYRQLIGRYENTALKIRPLSEYRKTRIQNTFLPLILLGLVLGFLIFNSISGLFGVLWYNISLRRSEIGLRMAVGASKSHIYKQFIGEMLVLATLGIIPGLIITAQFPILSVFNIETKVYLLAMLIAALLIYLLVTLCAILPSANAAKIQPAIALHEE